MSPSEFWRITPYLTAKAAPALRDKAHITAWLGAALDRQKKLPSLSSLLAKKAQVEPSALEAKMKNLLTAHNARRARHG